MHHRRLTNRRTAFETLEALIHVFLAAFALLELLHLPLDRRLLVGVLKVREDLRRAALARGAPDDAQAGLDRRLQTLVRVLDGVRRVEVVQHGGDAVGDRVQAPGELADADFVRGQGGLQ